MWWHHGLFLKHPSVVTFSWYDESVFIGEGCVGMPWFFREPRDVTGQSWYTKATFPRSPWGKEVLHKVAKKGIFGQILVSQHEVTGITTPDFGKHPERTEVYWRQRLFDTWSEVSAFEVRWCLDDVKNIDEKSWTFNACIYIHVCNLGLVIALWIWHCHVSPSKLMDSPWFT